MGTLPGYLVGTPPLNLAGTFSGHRAAGWLVVESISQAGVVEVFRDHRGAVVHEGDDVPAQQLARGAPLQRGCIIPL